LAQGITNALSALCSFNCSGCGRSGTAIGTDSSLTQVFEKPPVFEVLVFKRYFEFSVFVSLILAGMANYWEQVIIPNDSSKNTTFCKKYY
jgi:hypothetical protein